MKRREFFSVIGWAIALPLDARAQSGNSRLVGLLMAYEEENAEGQRLAAAFRDGLARLGLREGQEIKIAYRWTGTNDDARMQQAAKELVALSPDVIVSSGSPTTVWLLRETHTIPIVFAQVVDPVAQGLAASVSRPGGNATGLANFEPSMTGKWIELLKTVSPQVTRVVIPYNPSSAPYADIYLKSFRSMAPSFGVELIAARVDDLEALDKFCAAQNPTSTAAIPMPSGFVSGNLGAVASIMERSRLPSLYVIRAYAEAGGLLSYGNDIDDNFRRAAGFVARILKGEKASGLPIEFPVKLELAVNTRTAKLFGLHIPQQLLATADEVIE